MVLASTFPLTPPFTALTSTSAVVGPVAKDAFATTTSASVTKSTPSAVETTVFAGIETGLTVFSLRKRTLPAARVSCASIPVAGKVPSTWTGTLICCAGITPATGSTTATLGWAVTVNSGAGIDAASGLIVIVAVGRKTYAP